MRPPEPACRLYALLAGDGRSAVVFRRGPSREVCLVRWWLASDTFEIGQWLKGRIYERRGDLSHDGELLIYFAAIHKAPVYSWTAVSRPPYLTALAFWPKGDCWGGGGRLASRHHVLLNHGADALALGNGFKLPSRVRVEPIGEWAGRGEDFPVCHDRMVRDGWLCTAPGVAGPYSRTGHARWTLHEPELYERAQPARARHASGLVLQRALRAVGVVDGPWYREDFMVLSPQHDVLRTFESCDWADWQATGDLLLARQGKLYRLPAGEAARASPDPLAGARELIDLAPLRFEPLSPPDRARRWA